MRGLEYYLHDMMHNNAGSDGQDQQAKGGDEPDWRVWCYWLAHYKRGKEKKERWTGAAAACVRV